MHSAENDAPPTGRYIVGYFCHKGSGHFEMYGDPDVEMACGSSLAPVYLDADDAAWYRTHDLLPPGRWEHETTGIPPADHASPEFWRATEGYVNPPGGGN